MLVTISVIAGYLASLLLAISLLVNNDIKFRWINTCGNFSFLVYGILIHAFPVILTNSILLLINVYKLVKIYTTLEDFDLIEFKGEEKLMTKFLAFYQKDIDKYFPGFDMHGSTADIRFVVIRDIVIANVFVASLQPDGTALVQLNYTVPKYRDYKIGRFLFGKEKSFLQSKGVRRIAYKKVYNPQHERFLKVMGFKKDDADSSIAYSRIL
jgi:hypothetical protein